ncbi:hypothetical protein [Pseudogulbenkiania subflava]|uniref:Uncharacterized protein n=1 Tax=Pseudogulbenkiania subflava DSM 22618 TaxID=1123014 RepID=A0A1Y6BHP5_9NEIS|nr:hypothetical protein [Pseudogulbenkiania subflava]SMF04059.1 hypothetical protein SAMN02745746_00924 [Pseudogulbenkiania subflava DSM 22618]
MSLSTIADAISQIAPFYGSAADLNRKLEIQLGEDQLQRPPYQVLRLVYSKAMKKLLAERNVQISVDADRQILIERKIQ